MGNRSKSIFSPVGTGKEKDDVLNALVSYGSPLFAKTDSGQSLQLVPTGLSAGTLLVQPRGVNESELGGANGASVAVTLTFFQNEKYYFMSTRLLRAPNGWSLKVDKPELFVLQRRDTFRLKIPPNRPFQVLLANPSDATKMNSYPLFDLNGGGLAFTASTDASHQFAARQILDGKLVIPGKIELEFKAEVRHLTLIDPAAGLYKVGLQFQGLDARLEGQLVGLVMQLYRELYMRKS